MVLVLVRDATMTVFARERPYRRAAAAVFWAIGIGSLLCIIAWAALETD